MQQNDSENWVRADEAWFQYIEQHPELGAKKTPGSWVHFQRVHAPALIQADVIRRLTYRGRMIADKTRFEQAVFNLLSTGNVDGKKAA